MFGSRILIATQPLLDLCEGATQRDGAQVTLRWWDQTGIDWEKAKAREAETESASELETDMEVEEARDTESRTSGSSGGGMERSKCGRMGSTAT